MSAIQNQQTALEAFISINGVEITNHGRTHTLNEVQSISDIESMGGRLRRYYRDNKRNLIVELEYVPGPATKTVDGRVGRDYVKNLAETSPFVFIQYKDSPVQEPITFDGFIQNYAETLVRRDLPTQCSYYNLQFEIQEQ